MENVAGLEPAIPALRGPVLAPLCIHVQTSRLRDECAERYWSGVGESDPCHRVGSPRHSLYTNPAYW